MLSFVHKVGIIGPLHEQKAYTDTLLVQSKSPLNCMLGVLRIQILILRDRAIRYGFELSVHGLYPISKDLARDRGAIS